jgi:hypothetical protein
MDKTIVHSDVQEMETGFYCENITDLNFSEISEFVRLIETNGIKVKEIDFASYLKVKLDFSDVQTDYQYEKGKVNYGKVILDVIVDTLNKIYRNRLPL